MIPSEAQVLRLYLNASRRWRGRPAYQAAVEAARALGLAGASAFPVELGFGAHRELRNSASDYSFVDAPVVVEVVDAPERIEALTAELGPLLGEGFATVGPCRVVRYEHHEGRPRPGG